MRGDGGPDDSSAMAQLMASAPAPLQALDSVAGTGAGAGAEARSQHHGDDGESIARRLSHVDILTNTLMWRHLAPTAPDTLGCYPHIDADPFVIDAEHIPHLLFAGGAPAFGTRLVRTAVYEPAGSDGAGSTTSAAAAAAAAVASSANERCGAGSASAWSQPSMQVRVIAVPDFAATRTVVLVNLRSPTLEVQPITFTVGSAEAAALQRW